MTASDPLVGREGCPLQFLIPLVAFAILFLGALGASSLVPPLFIPNYAPGWAPGLLPAKSGHAEPNKDSIQRRKLVDIVKGPQQ